MERIKEINKEILESEMNYKYTYTLVKDEIEVRVDGKEVSLQSYGIVGEERILAKGEILNVDSEEIFNITPYRHKAEELIKLLADNLVSPIHMVDILGEYVDNGVSDYDEYDLNKVIINN